MADSPDWENYLASLFLSRGYLTLAKEGTTSIGRPRYVISARILVPGPRRELLGILHEHFGGDVRQAYYHGRSYTWTVKSVQAVKNTIRIVRESGFPIHDMLEKELDIVERYFALKVKRGRKPQTKQEERVWVDREKLYEEMKAHRNYERT